MPKIHCLTVGAGDCTIIQHGSGRVTMIDICGGNRPREADKSVEVKMAERAAKPRGNFAMCKAPTHPLDYIEENGLKKIFRFILTHPDMDHIDGFDALLDAASVFNFWDSGARREKPDFSIDRRYDEDDWDRYVQVRDRKEPNMTIVAPRAGSSLQYANQGDPDGKGDYIHVVAPSPELVDQANESQEFNDASYILVYRSAGGKIVIPGDADNKAWEHAIDNYPRLLKDVAFLLAPHHGRDSDREWDFLDHLCPRFTLLGCAEAKHLAYSAWRDRGLDYVTQNQAGNVVLDSGKGAIEVFIENDTYAEAAGGDIDWQNEQGYCHLKTI